MTFCCFCGKTHKKEEDCWLRSKEADEQLWTPIFNHLESKKNDKSKHSHTTRVCTTIKEVAGA